ncbi:MAG TPA: hypothetical protein VFX31_08475, partial [Ktedonobacterales bacterium]|nr:hypothetical protein [Ktedonobacterales bacterium]
MTERPDAPSARLDVNDRNDPGGLNDRARYWAFRLLAALAPLAPLWLAQRIAVAAGALLWLCAGGLRRRAERTLGRIPTLAADPARLRAATRGVFINLAL